MYVKKFEARWLQEENIMQLVTDAWEHTDPATSLSARTTTVHAVMHDWDRENLKAPNRRLKDLKAESE